MCASIYSSLLLFILTAVFIISGPRMATEGLPLVRQERGADSDLLTGADFLSVFMSSSLRHAYRETTTNTPEPTTTETYTRATRSTSFTSSIAQTEDSSSYATTLSAQFQKLEQSSDSVVVAETDRTQSDIEDTTIREMTDRSFAASEEHPSIVAEANKSEFSVEESEPITSSDLRDDFREYPASVHPLPRPNSPLSEFISKEKFQPLHQTVIYHNNPRDPGHASSVSYSTVIQSVPHPAEAHKPWENKKHERHERHFDSSPPFNNFHDKINETKPDRSFTTERNWEIHEKPYTHFLPTVYAKPEQNYEIDESASVMTNGRLHGIQPNPTLPSKQEVKIGESRKVDDNQKVGYVVEGRNYRKYRVEERTSDGFIVGEYGVVSHDDGSLRGVRYTADGTISPRLIYDALMKFLSL